VSFAHNPKCSAGNQRSGVRIQNRDVSYEDFLFFVAVTWVLDTNATCLPDGMWVAILLTMIPSKINLSEVNGYEA